MSDTDDNVKRKPGRPHGARNKSMLLKAQLKVDELTLDVALMWEAMIKNDKDALNAKDDVPYSVRFNAGKAVMDKAIANERDKEPSKPAANGKTTEPSGEVVHTGPQVFSTAIKK